MTENESELCFNPKNKIILNNGFSDGLITAICNSTKNKHVRVKFHCDDVSVRINENDLLKLNIKK